MGCTVVWLVDVNVGMDCLPAFYISSLWEEEEAMDYLN